LSIEFMGTACSNDSSHPAGPKTLAEWLAHTERLHAQTIDMGLARAARVRDAMGLNPSFPIITVAGTNGKGSTCALLAACLGAAGYRVGVYTSPHLVRYNERVRLGDSLASDEALCNAFAKVEAARGEAPLTPFEFGTLAAMQLFMDARLDVVILEVGLGGRLDAVNIFNPDCAIITSIALDHEAYLGNTREAIGFEKAGVFRAGRPAICADPAPPESIAQTAQSLGAELRQLGRDFSFSMNDRSWSFTDGTHDWSDLPLLKLSGDFQLRNASAALAALATVEKRLPIPIEALRRGLAQASIAGRFQKIAIHPDVVVDVAHNPHAAAELANNLRGEPCSGETLAVFGMLRDKDIAGVVALMDPLVDAWFVSGIEDRRGTTLEEVLRVLSGVRGAVSGFGHVDEAYRAALAAAGKDDRVVVFGSFITVGAVLALQRQENSA
jgi:dihydrofolate synthase/folylpolyglutamate synthase